MRRIVIGLGVNVLNMLLKRQPAGESNVVFGSKQVVWGTDGVVWRG